MSKTLQRPGPLTRLRAANAAAAQAAIATATAADAQRLRDSLRRFKVDGHECTLAALRADNADDLALIEWAESAEIGDRFPAFVVCIRIA